MLPFQRLLDCPRNDQSFRFRQMAFYIRGGGWGAGREVFRRLVRRIVLGIGPAC